MPRLCPATGQPLPDNLYADPRKRPGIYRYRRPDGTYKQVRATYAVAVRMAEEANAARNAPERSLIAWVEAWICECEADEPALRSRRAWVERSSLLRGFARSFANIPPSRLSVAALAPWWSGLTYDQQHGRRDMFSKFFVWLMGRGVARSNPFTRRDDVPALQMKRKPAKQRRALDIETFWQIHDQAQDWLQCAMVISLSTAMRAGDIESLRWDQVRDGYLHCTIRKSVAQRGVSAAAHLKWSLEEHQSLGAAINRARELSLVHRRCPFIISKRPQRTRKAAGRVHTHQIARGDLSRAFKNAREKAGILDADAPTFHEIRGLAIQRLLASGIDIAAVQRFAAHTDATTTSAYTAGHAPEYVDLSGMVVPTGRPA